MSAPRVWPDDILRGWKEITVAQLDGRLAVARVKAPTEEYLAKCMAATMSPAQVRDFVATVTGRSLDWIRQLHPKSYAEVFIVATGLLGCEAEARAAARTASEHLTEAAEVKHG